MAYHLLDLELYAGLMTYNCVRDSVERKPLTEDFSLMLLFQMYTLTLSVQFRCSTAECNVKVMQTSSLSIQAATCTCHDLAEAMCLRLGQND